MTRWRVLVTGRDVSFPVSEGQTLLDGAEAAGQAWPFGCRFGSCLNCAARLVAGHVSMAAGTALEPAHVEAGLFLPCSAEARSDLEVEVGGAMGLLDVPPWGGGG